MMKTVIFVASMLATTQAFAQASPGRDDIAFAIDKASVICLSGTKYKLAIDGNGKLNILRIQPGGEFSVIVEGQKTRGGVDFNDEKIREIFDGKTRDCMRDTWREVITELRKKSDAASPPKFENFIVQFRFDQSWVRYFERTNLSTIRDRNGRPVYERIENPIATVYVDGSKVGQVSESRSGTITRELSNGDHYLGISLTVPGNQILECPEKIFNVNGSSIFEVIAVPNKNYASPQNNMRCELQEVPSNR